MSGRHETQLIARRWAPTAFAAVVACTPGVAMLGALGLAAGGYLVASPTVAACGATLGTLGLIIERHQSRHLRRRRRAERSESRRELSEVYGSIERFQAQLEQLRIERDTANERVETLTVEHARELAEVLEQAHAEQANAEQPRAEPVHAELVPVPAVSLLHLIPGQIASPVSTGGIPLLRPGPGVPLPAVVDLRALAGPRPALPPLPHRPSLRPEAIDALVYASMAESEADELTLALDVRGGSTIALGRHAGALHTGDAHHAGDWAREEAASPAGVSQLLLVKRGKHAA